MEKHQTFRLGKAIIFFSAFFAAMVFVFVACRQDMDLGQAYTLEADKPISQEIQVVKDWFEANYKFNPSKIKEPERFGKMQPIWKDAIMGNGKLEVPILMNDLITIPSMYQGLSAMGKQRLIIIDKGDTRSMVIVNMMPSENFQGKMKEINLSNYWKKGFDGLIAVFTVYGKSLGAYSFKEGILKKKLKKLGPNVPETCTCDTYTYDCHCGRVNDGELQCSTCTQTDCYGDCGNDDDPCNSSNPPSYCTGGDPCDDFDPPAYCTGNDPCNGPNPPPSCTGGGDDTDCHTQECRCQEDPTLPECGCPDQTNLYATDLVGTYSRGIYGVVRFVARITNASIRGDAYTISPMEFQLRQSENSGAPPTIPSVFSFTESSAGYANVLNEQTCTRTIQTGHYGMLTHTFEAELGGVVVKSTATYNWGQFIGNWVF